ncbi:MAG: energy transducer TonB [Cyclobacteriaceae bacterium]
MKILLTILLFSLATFSVSAQENSDDKVLGEIIETNPEYPGGMEQFFAYVRDNESTDEKGKVFVSFFVEPTGEISEPSIVMGINEEVDNMVLDLIKAMPKWKPAMYQGKAVRKKMVLPIDI